MGGTSERSRKAIATVPREYEAFAFGLSVGGEVPSVGKAERRPSMREKACDGAYEDLRRAIGRISVDGGCCDFNQ